MLDATDEGTECVSADRLQIVMTTYLTQFRQFSALVTARVNEIETPSLGIYRVLESVAGGLLIQTSLGIASGVGWRRTKRSGCC